MCFVWIWEQTGIISLYSIKWLDCITETECVYCAVRTGSLNIIQLNLRFQVSVKHRWNDVQPPMLDTFVYMLLLTEGQTGEAWEPPIKQRSSGNRWALGIEVLPLRLKGLLRSQYHWYHRQPWYEWTDGRRTAAVATNTFRVAQLFADLRRAPILTFANFALTLLHIIRLIPDTTTACRN